MKGSGIGTGTDGDCRKVVLASRSPRRQEILARLGIEFEVRDVAVCEAPIEGEPPEETAERLAVEKVRAAMPGRGELVIGADTLVVLGREVLGKPGSATEAREMLEALRGKWHRVITSVALMSGTSGETHVQTEVTRVRMRDYGDAEIAAYVESGEPYDKAGAYAIQSTDFDPVAEIQGCYLNVVGLPVCRLVEGLRRFGCHTERLRLESLPLECQTCPDLRA